MTPRSWIAPGLRQDHRIATRGLAGLRVAILASTALAFVAPVSAQSRVKSTKVRRHHISRHVTQITDGLIELETDAERDRFSDGSLGTQVSTTGRLRLADGLQVNAQFPMLSTSDGGAMRLGDIAAGVTWRFFDGVPLVGDISALPNVKLPTGSTDLATGTGTVDVGVLMIASRAMGRVEVDLSGGYTRRSGDGSNAPRHSTVWSAAIEGPLHRSLGWSTELWGLPATSGPAGVPTSAGWTIGPTWSVFAWLTVDAAVMVPIAGPLPKAIFVSAVYKSRTDSARPASVP